jgi:putative tryptophan/tyrosine transport system substrate-binding protein
MGRRSFFVAGADLPIEQPTKFPLVVNFRAAKALGILLPESFLIAHGSMIG